MVVLKLKSTDMLAVFSLVGRLEGVFENRNMLCENNYSAGCFSVICLHLKTFQRSKFCTPIAIVIYICSTAQVMY